MSTDSIIGSDISSPTGISISDQTTSASALPIMNTSAHLIVSMPIPGTQNAPLFDKVRVKQFLDVVRRHGEAAHIDENEKVDYIYLYSSEDVQDTLRYMPKFDVDLTTKTWATAKDMLIALYGAMDLTPTVTLEDLRKFCQAQTAKSSFTSKGAVDRYNQAFQKFAAPLFKDGLLTASERNFYFITGIPKDMKEWFFNMVPEANRTRSQAPTIVESVKYLYSKFDKNSLLYEPWKNDEDKDGYEDIHLDRDGFRKAGTSSTAATKVLEKEITKGTKDQYSMDDLVAQLEQLRLSHTQVMSLMSSLSGRNHSPQGLITNEVPKNSVDYPRASVGLYPKRCFMCGKEEKDMLHELHPSKCDETPKLVRERLIKFDEDSRRYVLPDGKPLPRIPGGYAGGMAGYLRDLNTATNTVQNSRSGPPRDIPPHMSRSTSVIELMYGHSDVLQGDGFAISSLDAYDSVPALRSGRDTNVRFDPTRREDKGKQREVPAVSPPNSAPGPSQPKKNINIPPPSDPINRKEGWKDSLRAKDTVRDVRMKDEGKKEKYHFMSDIQSTTDVRKVYENIMNVTMTIPIREIIGSSPALQKLMADTTRMRKEYVTGNSMMEVSKAECSSFPSENVVITDCLCCENTDRIPEFLQRYASAVMKFTDVKLYAMATGKLTVNIKGVEVICLIDTGSELNVMDADIAEEAQLPIDFEGTKWSMKGIHGGPEPLKGVVTDVPMKVGVHDFPHHLFVSRYDLGKCKIILGQPFMRSFGAQLDFGFDGTMKMFMWKEPCDKSKVKPTITIALTDPKDPRNAAEITRCFATDRQAASIEEVENEEDF